MCYGLNKLKREPEAHQRKVQFIFPLQIITYTLMISCALYLCGGLVRDGVDERIKVEGWQIRILCLDEHNVRHVVPK